MLFIYILSYSRCHDFPRRLLQGFMSALNKDPSRGLWGGLLPVAFAGIFAVLALYLRAGPLSPYLSFEPWFSTDIILGTKFQRNVSLCPGNVFISRPYRLVRTNIVLGYDLTSVETSEHGLIAKLVLAGKECHAYGTDHNNLVVEVTYETDTR